MKSYTKEVNEAYQNVIHSIEQLMGTDTELIKAFIDIIYSNAIRKGLVFDEKNNGKYSAKIYDSIVAVYNDIAKVKLYLSNNKFESSPKKQDEATELVERITCMDVSHFASSIIKMLDFAGDDKDIMYLKGTKATYHETLSNFIVIMYQLHKHLDQYMDAYDKMHNENPSEAVTN